MKKRTNLWTKTPSRKSAKKGKSSGVRQSDTKDDNVLLKPFHQEDDPSYPILLSKIYKAEKIDLSADRLTASGSKGYRMVIATRGIVEGAWYFEIYVDRLGDTGHTRLGWSTRKADLQAPVGYDTHSYSYRDGNGCKVHAALWEEYGDSYHEKDVLGFYINLPREQGFMQKPEKEVFGYKGQPYIIIADEPLRTLPGSEILFFKNGVCQGVAFKDINDGTYFPAASMYTLPSQDCCKVIFNFGPDFRYPVTDLGDRPLPLPMCQASGPREARMETVPTTQTEQVVDSMVYGGHKCLAPEQGNAMEVEVAPGPSIEENAPKEVKNLPPVAKKVNKPNAQVVSHIPPNSSRTYKSGGFQLHPEPKRETILKSFKNYSSRLGVGSSGLLIEKGAKKDIAGAVLPISKGVQNNKGSLNLKGIPKKKWLSDLKGMQKGKGPSLKQSNKVFTVTEMPSSKGVKQDKPVLGISCGKGTGLQDLIGNQKDFPLKGSQNFQESKKDLTAARLQSSKGSERETSGIGLPKSQKIKKDWTGTKSIFNTSKDFTGTGLALNASRKGLHGIGPALKADKKVLPETGPIHNINEKGLPGTGSTQNPSKKDCRGSRNSPRGLGASALRGGKSWEDGMRGTTMDVDVVVVEPSSPTQAEGPFRFVTSCWGGQLW